MVVEPNSSGTVSISDSEQARTPAARAAEARIRHTPKLSRTVQAR